MNNITTLSVSGNHANKYPDDVDKATRPGISTFYKHEIHTLIREEMWKQPKAILNILTKRRTDGVPGYDAPLPELRQIRNYKRNMNTPHNNEYEEVLKRIKDLSTGLEELDEIESYGLECLYKGRHHTHTINFNTKSCTCRWFLAFAVCSHIIGACDQYNRELQGYKATRAFVYKAKRGRKP